MWGWGEAGNQELCFGHDKYKMPNSTPSLLSEVDLLNHSLRLHLLARSTARLAICPAEGRRPWVTGLSAALSAGPSSAPHLPVLPLPLCAHLGLFISLLSFLVSLCISLSLYVSLSLCVSLICLWLYSNVPGGWCFPSFQPFLRYMAGLSEPPKGFLSLTCFLISRRNTMSGSWTWAVLASLLDSGCPALPAIFSSSESKARHQMQGFAGTQSSSLSPSWLVGVVRGASLEEKGLQ